MKKSRLLLLITVTFTALMLMTSCNPTLALNQKFAYTNFEIDMGEEISDSIETYVDFSELSADEQSFVKDNSEILLDGKPLEKADKAPAGDHELTINYCGSQYRKYNIKITDKIPPEFTKNEDLYTFEDIPISEDLYETMFSARDNSGQCRLKISKSSVDFSKAGKYTMKATATDPSGNKSKATANVIVQKPAYGAKGTYVFVSIANQTLTYFVDGEVVLETPVVTGNAWNHSTPTGTFTLLNKATNTTLKGLEDDGKTEYESFVYYWMAFIGGTYGLHDATWRGSFGGNIYMGNGSHGCVNMPVYVAGELFRQIELGTPVLVY